MTKEEYLSLITDAVFRYCNLVDHNCFKLETEDLETAIANGIEEYNIYSGKKE